MTIEIGDIKLVQTSFMCPEQYDAFIGDKQVGYLRLRSGWFRVDYPDCGGETIYEAYPKGDGCFRDDESEKHLEAAKIAIIKRLANQEIQ